MKKTIIILIIILVLAITTSTYSIYRIQKWNSENTKNENIVKEINEKIEIKEQKDTEDTIIIEPVEKTNDIYRKYLNTPLIDVNFTELNNINTDVKGWIKVEGTTINYPFVQTTNNSYYLNHSFDKSKNNAGWIFLDYRNNLLKDEKNTIIYAHNRLNETMFGSLSTTLTDKWYSNPANHYIKISTTNQNSVWQIFSIYTINKNENDYLKINFSKESKYNDFLRNLINKSQKKFTTSIYTTDKILTLSTCHEENERFIVHAKLVKYEKKEV